MERNNFNTKGNWAITRLIIYLRRIDSMERVDSSFVAGEAQSFLKHTLEAFYLKRIPVYSIIDKFISLKLGSGIFGHPYRQEYSYG
jgi:hypothetical protein